MPYKDPEKAKERSRDYYLKNRDKIIKRSSTWNIENKERRKLIVKKNNDKSKNRKRLWHESKYFDGNMSIKENSMCKICNVKINLIIHHLDGCNGKNGKSLNNNPSNLIILCRSCHPKYHGSWGIKEVV